MSSPCDVKLYFDTEFEATIAASKVSYKYDTEMIPYRCGRHWHLANKDKKLRSRRRGWDQMYCKDCDCYMKRGQWSKHIYKRRHIKLADKKEETPKEVSQPEQLPQLTNSVKRSQELPWLPAQGGVVTPESEVTETT